MKIEYRVPTVEEYSTLRGHTNWWEVDRKSVETALNSSLFAVVAVENNHVIGFGRIVGDGLYFYIHDLIVHKEYRNRGIGKSLMVALMDYLKNNVRPGSFIGLMAAKGLTKYYESFGFKVRDEESPGMFQLVSQ